MKLKWLIIVVAVVCSTPIFALDRPMGEDDGGKNLINQIVSNYKLAASTASARGDTVSATRFTCDADNVNNAYNLYFAKYECSSREVADLISGDIAVFENTNLMFDRMKYLSRFARTRECSVQEAVEELKNCKKVFLARHRSSIGGKDTSDFSKSHKENLIDWFDGFLDAMRKIEDKYDWQFNKQNYGRAFEDLGLLIGKIGLKNAYSYGHDEYVNAVLAHQDSLRGQTVSNNRILKLGLLK